MFLNFGIHLNLLYKSKKYTTGFLDPDSLGSREGVLGIYISKIHSSDDYGVHQNLRETTL